MHVNALDSTNAARICLSGSRRVKLCKLSKNTHIFTIHTFELFMGQQSKEKERQRVVFKCGGRKTMFTLLEVASRLATSGGPST